MCVNLKIGKGLNAGCSGWPMTAVKHPMRWPFFFDFLVVVHEWKAARPLANLSFKTSIKIMGFKNNQKKWIKIMGPKNCQNQWQDIMRTERPVTNDQLDKKFWLTNGKPPVGNAHRSHLLPLMGCTHARSVPKFFQDAAPPNQPAFSRHLRER